MKCRIHAYYRGEIYAQTCRTLKYDNDELSTSFILQKLIIISLQISKLLINLV